MVVVATRRKRLRVGDVAWPVTGVRPSRFDRLRQAFNERPLYRQSKADDTFTPFNERTRCYDGAAVLSLYVGLLYLIPAKMVFGIVGAIGTPSILLGIPLFACWTISRLSPGLAMPGKQPVRLIVAFYLVTFLIAYALGYARGLPPDEASATDRNLLTTFALCGVCLMAADGIPTRARLDAVLRRLCGFGAAVCGIAAIQFFFSYDLTVRIPLPGLVVNGGATVVEDDFIERSGFNRVAGTAGHPIEFGALCAMLLPIAVHYLMYAEPGKSRRRWRLIAGLIALGVPLSISRSSTIGFLVAVVFMASPWSWAMLQRSGKVLLVGLAVVRVVVPGLIGSIKSLFTNLSEDDSTKARESDYPIVFHYIGQRPWFGRGPGTFGPEKYILLDNQILLTLVTMGYIGLLAFLGLFIGGFVLGRIVLRKGADDETRHLGTSLATALIVAGVSAYFADMLFFNIYSGTTFLLLGCVGALWRLRKEPSGSHAEGVPAVDILRPHWRAPKPKREMGIMVMPVRPTSIARPAVAKRSVWAPAEDVPVH